MENFTNETIDTKQLPRYEEVQLTTLHPKYWSVTLINLAIVFVVLGVATGLVWYNAEELSDYGLELSIGLAIIVVLTVF